MKQKLAKPFNLFLFRRASFQDIPKYVNTKNQTEMLLRVYKMLKIRKL